MGQAGGGSKVRKILWRPLCYGDRGDPGGTSLPRNFQHCGERSSKCVASVSLRDTGVTEWVGMSVRIAQHIFHCKPRSHGRPQPHIGQDYDDGGGKNV